MKTFWNDEPEQVVLEDQDICEMLIFLARAGLRLNTVDRTGTPSREPQTETQQIHGRKNSNDS